MNTAAFVIIILTSIILGLFGLFLAGVFLFHSRKMNQNKDKIQKLELEKAKKALVDAIEIQEAERARIGADIHDDLGPTLSAIKLKVNQIQSSSETNDKNINQLKEMINETITSVRSLSHSLYPNTLEKYGISNALSEMAQRIDGSGITVTCDLDPQTDSLPYYNQINIYRIIQEFCNNSIKHSQCQNINITSCWNQGHLFVKVTDDGIGFDSEVIKEGIGLKNMVKRAESIDFSLTFNSVLREGTTLTLSSKIND